MADAPAVSTAAHDAPADASEDAIARAFAAQRAFQRTTERTTADERIARLRLLRKTLVKRRADLQAACYADFRKPPEEVDLSEIRPTLDEIDYAVKHLKSWMKSRRVSTPPVLLGTVSEVRYEPKGVVLIIAPWNYPVTLTLGPLVSALAAGNSAIVKPSEMTPNVSALLEEIVEACFDPREVTLFEGDKAVAEALLQKPFDHIFFTGSPEIGKRVMKAAAEHLASVTLELGGKSPAIVDETADVEDAARKIAWGKFTNAGQTCIAPDYVLVHESQEADLVAALGQSIRSFYGETPDARQTTPDYARLVNEKHFERVQSLLEEATADGARIAAGGQASAEERYLAPTVLTDVPRESRIMDEEIFGPVLPVLTYERLPEALDLINERPNPLALYLFTSDGARANEVLERTSTGGTAINETILHYLNPALPFGGAGYSGIGRSHGEAGFKAFSNERAVLRRTLGSAAVQFLYPPYGSAARRIIDGVMRWL